MDNIRILEKLIIEFYNPYISNQRRKEIDNILQTYERSSISWRECMQYVEKNENILVSTFCLKMIETLISKHWCKLDVEDKTMLHNSLSNYLLHCQTNIPSSIKKYLMKLMAKIARNEWSTIGFSFINDIIKIVLSDDVEMMLFGLNFFLIASEELIEPRDIICSAKKLEIRHHFELNIPQIFRVLNGTFLKYKGTVVEEQTYEMLLLIDSQLFNWFPLSDVHTTDLLSPIYDCTSYSNYKIRMLALSALNEILYKNCVPTRNIPLITNICRKVNDILLNVSESNVTSVDDEYINKILETTKLILSVHWHRIESNMEVSDIILFVSSFYKFSFHTIDRKSYRICLDIWCNFLDYLTMRDVVHKKQYENLLNTLLEEILRKLYTEISIEENDEISQTEEEDKELDSLFNQHMNVIDLIIELSRDNSFGLIVNLWNRSKFIYMQSWSNGKTISPMSNPKEILEALYAFRVCTQVLTSLHSKSSDSLRTTMMKNLMEVVTFGNNEYVKSAPSYPSSLSRHFIKVHCTLLKAVPFWISNDDADSDIIITNIFTQMLPFITNSANVYVHEELSVAIAQLVSSLMVQTAQTNLIQPLFVDPTFKYLPIAARKHLQCALCHWVCICKNEPYNERLHFLQNLFETVAPNKLEDLEYICFILQNCKVTRSDGKELLLKALEPWLEHVIYQYTSNFAKPKMEDFLSIFILEVVKTFQNNLKSDFIERILLLFDNCSTNFSSTMDNVQVKKFEKMLKILSLVMEYPGHTYNVHISKVLNVAQNIFFFVQSKRAYDTSLDDNIDVEFYKLLCCILINKWSYFNTTSQTRGETNLSQPCLELKIILNRILESFNEADINIFRSNLRCVEEMNNKWNFYEKDFFRAEYLPSMLNSLLTTLIEGKHKLLFDEILTAVYHMAAVNFEVFYTSYIPSFQANITGLTDQQMYSLQHNFNPQTDLPSFLQTFSQLINDIRSYQLENGC